MVVHDMSIFLKKEKLHVISGVFLFASIMAAGGYIFAYSYKRQEAIAHNTECSRIIENQPVVATGSMYMPPCAFEPVPPPIGEKILRTMGIEPSGSVSRGCNQAATTADCAALEKRISEQ